MSRLLTTTLVATLLLGSMAAAAETQRHGRRLRASKGHAAAAQSVQTTNATMFKIKGRSPVVAQLPDLQIVRVTPDQDGRPPQKITIVNGGGMTASGCEVRVLAINAYGQTVYTVDIPSQGPLSRGAARTIQLPVGGYGASWSIRLDPNNHVREGNEKNNFWANNRER